MLMWVALGGTSQSLVPPYKTRHDRSSYASGSTLAGVGSSNAREPLVGADAGGQLSLVGDEHRQAVLDGEADGAAGADERLAVAGEGRLAGRVDGTAEECEQFVHGTPWVGENKRPRRVEPAGPFYIFASW